MALQKNFQTAFSSFRTITESSGGAVGPLCFSSVGHWSESEKMNDYFGNETYKDRMVGSCSNECRLFVKQN